ncbi:unnamed protein product, partial [Hapterophycus canaliculatus]
RVGLERCRTQIVVVCVDAHLPSGVSRVPRGKVVLLEVLRNGVVLSRLKLDGIPPSFSDDRRMAPEDVEHKKQPVHKRSKTRPSLNLSCEANCVVNSIAVIWPFLISALISHLQYFLSPFGRVSSIGHDDWQFFTQVGTVCIGRALSTMFSKRKCVLSKMLLQAGGLNYQRAESCSVLHVGGFHSNVCSNYALFSA